MDSIFCRYWRNIYVCMPRLTPRARTGIRFASTSFVLRTPPASASREIPTPLMFISASSWDASSSSGMTFLASMLAEKGFTSIQTDLAIPEASMKESKGMMQDYESEMASMARLTAIPFPPVIVARSSACLIAESYISSNPASGLVLISPPVSNSELLSTKLPTPLKEFDYEPNFPIAIITTHHKAGRLRESNRVCQSDNVDIITVDDVDDVEALVAVEGWLDKQGI